MSLAPSGHSPFRYAGDAASCLGRLSHHCADMSEPLFHMIAGAPAPVAPFSHAVEADGWVFLTGQMPTLPADDAAPLPEGIEEQTRRAMDNLIIVLRGLGLGLPHAVSVRVLPDTVRAGLCADEYGLSQLFSTRSPARAHLCRRHWAGAWCAGRNRPSRATLTLKAASAPPTAKCVEGDQRIGILDARQCLDFLGHEQADVLVGFQIELAQ